MIRISATKWLDYALNICPFTTLIKNFHCYTQFILLNTLKILNKLANNFDILSKWQKFAKSGHTELRPMATTTTATAVASIFLQLVQHFENEKIL